MSPDARSLHDLGLSTESLEGTEFDQIPESIGQTFPDPIQPGVYRFQLPVFQVTSPIWDLIADDKTNGHGQRLAAIFDNGFALQIVQSPGKTHDGEDYRLRISNVPRERTKERILVSDMDLLLRALGCTARPKTNKAYAEALAKFGSGKGFTATQEWSWRCDPNRDIYVDDGTGGQQQAEGQRGCGKRYYQRDVQKVEGVYPVRVSCGDCGASLRAFGNLGQFKA